MVNQVTQLSQQAPQVLPKIYLGVVILLSFWVIGIIIEKVTLFIGRKSQIHQDILTLLGRLAKTALILLGVVSALGTIGIDVSALVASLGLTGFALGFALRDALSNVLAGTLILIYRPFQIGDRIKVIGFEGNVLEVDLRYTTIQCDDKRVLIPNSNLFSNPVIIPQK